MKKLVCHILFLCFLSVTANAATYYISPDGDNANGGTSCSDAEKTFAALFSGKSAGDDYVLCSTDTITTYDWQDTGVLSFDVGECAACEQVPGGVDGNYSTVSGQYSSHTYILQASTYQYAALWIGRSFRKDGWIEIDGLHFDGGGFLYNSSRTWVHNSSFYRQTKDNFGIFGIGTNDHGDGNDWNLVEDCLMWGSDRLIALNYRSAHNIWRRVLMGSDGCATASCTGSGNPNVVFSVYESSFTETQNVLIVDRNLGGGEPYADFATAQHTDSRAFELHNNAWRGCLSLNSDDSGFVFEADYAQTPTHEIINCAVVVATAGFNIGAASVDSTLENLTVLRAEGAGADGIRMAPSGVSGGYLKNVVVSTSARYGINSVIQPSYSDVYNSGTADYNQTSCATGCLTSDPMADGTPNSIEYAPQIEVGSALDGTGDGGADYGSNIFHRYGGEGTFSGDASSITLTSNKLWPWPNESKWKTLRCATSSDDWCVTGLTLSEYVWDFLGNNGRPFWGIPIFRTEGTATWSGTLSITTE